MVKRILLKRLLFTILVILNLNLCVQIDHTNIGIEIIDTTINEDSKVNRSRKLPSLKPEQSNSTVFENNTVGFRLILPENKSIFNAFPKIKYEILNATLIEASFYRVSIFNTSDTPEWDSFYPLDPNNSSHLLDVQFLQKWNQTNESIPIFINFYVETTGVTYSINITKDFIPPVFQIGFQLTSTGNLIDHSSEKTYFTESPLVYLWISDNIENEVSIFYTINNIKYSANGFANDPLTVISNGTLSQLILKDFQHMPQGENTVYIYLNDTAGNPTYSQEFSFIKDTLAPLFASGDSQTHWVKADNSSLTKLYNPIYDSYEFDSKPDFSFSFKDKDIADFRILLNFTKGIGHIGHPYPELDNITLEFESLLSIKIDSNTYRVDFPDRFWEAMETNDLLFWLELEDNAGNINSKTLKLSRIMSQTSQTNSFLLFLLLVGIIVISIVFTLLYSPIYTKLWKRHNPLEEDLKLIDPELLDVVLPPIDSAKAQRVMELSKHNGNSLKGSGDLPPDLEDFLSSPMQLVDLSEIRMLLNKFQMDPLQQEEFLREMVALTPEERFEFLQNFMNPKDADFSEMVDTDDFF